MGSIVAYSGGDLAGGPGGPDPLLSGSGGPNVHEAPTF